MKITDNTYIKWFPWLFFIIAFLLYADTLRFHEYVLDDEIYTTKNSYVQRGISSFTDIISHGTLKGFDGSNVADYRPVVLINFALEKSVFGNKPKVNHFFNVLIYAFLCSFLFVFLRKLLKNYPLYIPALVTLLFVVHPIHTEVVANIKSRDELLCMFFGLVTLNNIYDYPVKCNIRYLIYSGISFFLCLVSKESGYAYIAVVPLTLYFFTALPLRRIAVLMIPFIVIAAITLFIRMLVLDSMLLKGAIPLMNNSLMAASTTAQSVATNFTMLWKALVLLFFPLTLSWDYSYNQFPIVNWSNATALISLLVHISLLFVAIAGLRKKSVFSFIILFYFLSYVITSNLILKVGSSFAERFLFTPSLAFCIALPLVLFKLFKPGTEGLLTGKSKYIAGITLLFTVLFAVRTYSRNYIWKDNITLDASGLLTAPNSARTHYAVADDYCEKVKTSSDMEAKREAAQMAISEYQKSLDIHLVDSVTYYNMGMIYLSIGDTNQAAIMFDKALALKPNDEDALNSYGMLLLDRKNYLKALSYFKRALESKPGNAEPFANAALCYQNMGDNKSAIIYYERALQLNPSFRKIYSNLADIYISMGDTLKAHYFRAQADEH